MSKHGFFTDEWFPCPLGCGLGVTIDGDEMPCAICGRRWTIYNYPSGDEKLFGPSLREGQSSLGEEPVEEVDPTVGVDRLDD